MLSDWPNQQQAKKSSKSISLVLVMGGVNGRNYPNSKYTSKKPEVQLNM